MIDARALRKTFGEVTAVEDVSFHAPDGRITGLLGPNGAGKSTTMRMLHGIMRPDSGTVKVDGINVSTHAVDARRRIGVLPDALGLYPRLTAIDRRRVTRRACTIVGRVALGASTLKFALVTP